MIKTILFDADGVLINGEYFSYYLERDFGIKRDLTREFFEGEFLDCIVGKRDLKTELVPYLKKWGWKESYEEFIDDWHKSEHNIDNDLVEYIQNLRKKGITCCLATNQNRHRFSYMLKEMGFANFFDRLYASDFLGHMKPSPKFYEKIIDDLKITNKKEVLFWDDTEQNILAARKFGIHAETYKSFEDFKNKMKTYLQI